MLKVTVELGDRVVGVMEIVNIHGPYEGKIYSKGSVLRKQGQVENQPFFPVWSLIAKMLKAMGYI